MNLKRDFDYIELGATLYTPAINKNILQIANGKKFTYLKSIVFCLEDAIKESDLKYAMLNIKNFLKKYKRDNIKVFIRPRDNKNLKQLLKLKKIEKIDGFALAKFGIKNMKKYFNSLKKYKNRYHIMPILESNDMFDIDKLRKIKKFFLKKGVKNILTLRIGGEDMLKTMNLKKDCQYSIHNFHISSKIFADIFSIFKPIELNITAPVYNCLKNEDIFIKEVKRDIKEGFFGKTIIHPNQAIITNNIYKVSQDELNEAKEILNINNNAIFRYKDKMCEPSAHNSWAKTIIKRASIYGVIN